MTSALILLALVFTSGWLAGSIYTLQKSTKHLKEQNDLLEQQNKIIADLQRREEAADWWKPEDWKADWTPGDA